MKVVAAYMLCLLGGNSNPSAKDLTAVLSSGASVGDLGRIHCDPSNMPNPGCL